MTETEFRGLKLMMLERYRKDKAENIEPKRWIRDLKYDSSFEKSRDYSDHSKLIKNACDEFGVDEQKQNQNLDNILKKCFEKAWTDATLERAYSLPGKDARKTLGDECHNMLVGVINSGDGALIRARKQNEFDYAHHKLAASICKTINDKVVEKSKDPSMGKKKQDILAARFEFGNAQKLINMFLKYCYVLSLYFSESKTGPIGEFVKKINAVQACLHVPIDNVMLMVLRGDAYSKVEQHPLIKAENPPSYKIFCRCEKKNADETCQMKDGKPIIEQKCSWSKIPLDKNGYKAYKRLQKLCRDKAAKDCLSPIAWECTKWLEAR